MTFHNKEGKSNGICLARNLITPFFVGKYSKSQVMKARIFTLTLAIALTGQLIFAKVSKAETKTLKALFEATNGSSWTNTWDLSESPEKWHGVVVQDNKVVELNLFNNNLVGHLPEDLSGLKKFSEFKSCFQ